MSESGDAQHLIANQTVNGLIQPRQVCCVLETSIAQGRPFFIIISISAIEGRDSGVVPRRSDVESALKEGHFGNVTVTLQLSVLGLGWGGGVIAGHFFRKYRN